ncbi:MAG: YjjG family noncanonical pyrimidine nucleotidase [Tannerellaceae bacterium]|jgi:putative hydrolase of the HAD superfamily|nr:YjjG family noncanonical pyrimidine nucleotidase [Tannerellaceae bacterium]
MYKSLFFDFDDTLWDTQLNNKACLEDMYADYHFDRYYTSFEAFYDYYAPHNQELWRQYRHHIIDRYTLTVERFRHILIPAGVSDAETALRLNRDFLERTTQKTALIAGAVDLLEYLRPHYRVFLLSNGFREVQRKKLERSGLADYFERLILSEDAGIQKPHKEIFDFALKNTNSRRRQTLMIGDCWEADIAGAYYAGIDQLWLNPRKLPPLEDFTPTFTVDSLAAIQAIL